MCSPLCTHLAHSHTKANTHFCASCSPFLLFFCSGLHGESDYFCRPTCKFALSLSLFHLGAEKWPLVSKQLCRPGRERGLKKGREEREEIQWTSGTLLFCLVPALCFFLQLSPLHFPLHIPPFLSLSVLFHLSSPFNFLLFISSHLCFSNLFRSLSLCT